MNNTIDLILSRTQKEHLVSLIGQGLKVRAIKELRDLIPKIGLVEARDYIYDIYDMIENEKIKMVEKEEKENKKITITTYNELKEYLMNKEMVEKDNDSLWDIIDMAFDAGMEEGETKGYKIRLNEEADEK